MRRAVLLVALALAGCSKGDPATSLLSPGQSVILYSAVHPGVTITIGESNVVLPVGTKARVGRDSGTSSSGFRAVSIVITEGKHAGAGDDVPRSELRPIK